MKINYIITKEEIESIIHKCVDELKNYDIINTIVLFGSYARGDYSVRHSDIDLYILINGIKNNNFERELWRKLNKISTQIQIHLNFEYNELLKEGSLLRYNILKEGKILYEKNKTLFLKKDFDLEEIYLIQMDLSNLKANQKSNFKRTMTTKYKNYLIKYSGNIIIINKIFYVEFYNICKNKKINLEVLNEFIYRPQKEFDENIEN